MNKQYNLITLSIVFLLAIISSISAVSVVNVISTPSEVAPGEIVDINMEIENIFEYDIYNLNIKLDLSSFDVPFAPFQSSSERFLDKLKDGDDERFSFKLIAIPSAGSGIYKLPIQITYEDNEGQLFSKSELISVTINSQPELKVSLELTEEDRLLGVTPFSGTNGQIFTLWTVLYTGGSGVYYQGMFVPFNLFQQVEKYKTTWINATPTYYAIIVKSKIVPLALYCKSHCNGGLPAKL